MARLEFAQWSGGEANTYRVFKINADGGAVTVVQRKREFTKVRCPMLRFRRIHLV
jgi:hypothetical protein